MMICTHCSKIMLKGAIFDLGIRLTEKNPQWLKSMGGFFWTNSGFLWRVKKKKSKMLEAAILNFPWFIVHCVVISTGFLIWFCLFVKKSRSYLARTKREKKFETMLIDIILGELEQPPHVKLVYN